MPSAYVKKMADKHGKSEDEAEKIWDKAKAQAKEQGHDEDYDYITSIFKKMIGEQNSFKEYMIKVFDKMVKQERIKTLKEYIEEESAPATTTTAGVAGRDMVMGKPSYRVPHDTYLKLLQGKKKGKRWKEIVDDLELTAELKKRLYARKKTLIQCDEYPHQYTEVEFDKWG